MKTEVVLFVHNDYIQVAVKPLEDKFKIICPANEECYSLYFYSNPNSSSVDYSINYKPYYLDGYNLYYGDYFKKIHLKEPQKYLLGQVEDDYINLIDPILKDIRKALDEEFSKYAIVNEDDIYDTYIIWSEDITPRSRLFFENHIQKFNFKPFKTREIPFFALNYLLGKNPEKYHNSKIAVVETISNDMNMYVCQIDDDKDISIIANKKFKDYGVDPRVLLLAQKIVISANKELNILADEKEQRNEINRHYQIASRIIKEEDNSPLIVVNTSFAKDINHKIRVTISKEDLDREVYTYSRQYANFFTNHLLASVSINSNEINQLLLIGQTLSNQTIIDCFNQILRDKIELLPNDNHYLLKSCFDYYENNPSTNEGNTFVDGGKLISGPIDEDVRKPKVVTQLDLKDLIIGDTVRIETFQNCKGASFQLLQYKGQNKFVVIVGNRGLVSADVVTAISHIWEKDHQIGFMVDRKGQDKGKFLTRPLVQLIIT